MRVSHLLEHFNNSLLLEANIYNIKTRYEKVSLDSYVEGFVEHLESQELKQLFTKKITRLLMNDERFLYALNELPANAPQWAKDAADKNELFYFKPTPDLDNQLIDIIHYLIAVEEDSKGNDPNKKAVATKELQGFQKAENIGLLIRKQQEYFSRGSKNAKRDVEGLEEVIALDSGFTWYKLMNVQAFQREGQLLQNCIGRHWSFDKARSEKMDIYVLRDQKSDSSVAVRVHTPTKAMHECKGKQNRAPVQRYMPSVQRLINDLKLIPSSSGMNDLKNAGYFYIRERLYSRAQAIIELTTPDTLFTMPNGNAITQLPLDETTIQNINALYKIDYTTSSNMRTHGFATAFIYELRRPDNTPLVALIVSARTILRIMDFATVDNDDALGLSEQCMSLIERLRDEKYIKEVSGEIISDFFWKNNLIVDKDLQDVKPSIPSSTYTEDNMTIEVYEADAAASIVAGLKSISGIPSYDNTFVADIERLYMWKKSQQAIYCNIIKTDLTCIPLMGGYKRSRYDETAAPVIKFSREIPVEDDDKLIDTNAIKFVIATANRSNVTLPLAFRLQAQLKDKDTNSKYQTFEVELEPVQGTVPAVKIDIEKHKTHVEKVQALLASFNLEGKKCSVMRNVNSRFKLKIDPYSIFKTEQTAYGNVGSVDNNTTTLRDLKLRFPEEKMPDAIYQLTLSYGADKTVVVGVVVKNKTIIFLDEGILKNTLQKHTDFDAIVKQLNTFVTEQKLAISPKFDDMVSHIVQYRYDPKTKLFTTRAAQAKQQLERSQGRNTVINQVREMNFEDGTVIKPMNADKFARWARHELERMSLAGLPFEIIQQDIVKCIFVVQYGSVIDMFTKSIGEDKFRSNLDGTYLPYIKAMATEFNWKTSKKLTLNYNKVKYDGTYDIIHSLYSAHEGTKTVYDVLGRRDAGKDPFEYGGILRGLRDKLLTLDFKNTPYTTPEVDPNTPGTHDYRVRAYNKIRTLSITELGKKYIEGIRGNNGLDIIKLYPAAPLQDFTRPTLPANAPRVAGEPRERVPMEGGGKKSDQALVRFREMTAANNGTIPTSAQFKAILMAPPFNMGAAGAQTYYYNTKAKYLAAQGQ